MYALHIYGVPTSGSCYSHNIERKQKWMEKFLTVWDEKPLLELKLVIFFEGFVDFVDFVDFIDFGIWLNVFFFENMPLYRIKLP